MGWINNLRSKVALGRKLDEQLYLVVAEELDRGSINQALWLKALEQADGDEQRQTAAYIKLRIQALRDDSHLQSQFNRQPVVKKRSVAITSPDTAPLAHPKRRELSDREILRLQGIQMFGEDEYQKIIQRFGREPRHAKRAHAMLSAGDATNLREAVEIILSQYLRESLHREESLSDELKMLAERLRPKG